MRIFIILIGYLTITSPNNLWAGLSSQETFPASEKNKFPQYVLIETDRIPLSSLVSREETFGESFLKELANGYKRTYHALMGMRHLPYYIYTHFGEMIMTCLVTLGIFQVIKGLVSLCLPPVEYSVSY